MLYDPARHESLRPLPWDEREVRAVIDHIVADTESRFTEARYWPMHPRDQIEGAPPGHIETSLYDGACGVFWALHYLGSIGAATPSRSYVDEWERLLARNREWEHERASFLVGDTPIQMMRYGVAPTEEIERSLESLIAGNIDHPAREMLWGSPGTLLAASFLHERTGEERWANLFRLTADRLWSQLEWSPRYQCAYWTQDFRGGRWTYLDGVHGFVATALPLIRGRHLLESAQWNAWERCIANTVRRTVERDGALANWRPELDNPGEVEKRLVQFCHGAPGFVICLASFPSGELDDLLLAAGELTWSAGPLTKGCNLCHGTGGNGYALLKLYQRTGDERWLERARSFAMHGIAQLRRDALRFGQMQYSLWTGDPGFAIYLADCLRREAQFPTLDVFYAPRANPVEKGNH